MKQQYILVVSVLLCLSGGFVALGQVASDGKHDQLAEEKNILETIIDEYASVESCSIEYAANTPDWPWARQELLVLNTGDYFVKDYQNYKDGPEELDYFVWVQDRKMRTSHGPHGYIDFELNDTDYANLYALPGPPHHAEDPWPMIASWCRAFAKDDSTTVTHNGEQVIIANEQHGISMAFDSQYHLIHLIVNEKPYTTDQYTYSGYTHNTTDLWDHPATYRAITTFTGKNAHTPITDSRTITRVQFNIPDTDEEMAFDPDKLTVQLYDPKTHNVYASDGTVLYNEDEVIASMDRLSGLRKYVRRGIWPLLLVLITLSGIVAYRRIKTGR